MESNQPINYLDNIFQWITRLAALNFCYIIFTISGFGLLGLFPATVASLGVARKWIMGEHDLKVFTVFKKMYRKEFLLSNSVGWMLTMIGGILYFNYYILKTSLDRFPIMTIFSFYIIIFVYVMIIIWIFPLLTHYDNKITDYFKNGFMIGISKPHITLFVLLLLFTFIYYSLEFPALLIFMTFSVSSITWNWFTLRVFRQLDTNYKCQDKNVHF